MGNLVSDGGSTPPVPNELLAAHQEIPREVLILSAITKDNMEQHYDGERFDAIAKKIKARLNSI